MIGVDPHKRLHVALAVDEAGNDVGEWPGPNSPEGWAGLSAWAADLGSARQWGIEGAWSYGRGISQQLVSQGETVYDINPRWTAGGRRSARRPGKTDTLDARAIALLVRQEVGSLPRVLPEDQTALQDLLTTERESAIVEATRLRNQIHAHLMQIDSAYAVKLPSLTSKSVSKHSRTSPLRELACSRNNGARRAPTGSAPAPGRSASGRTGEADQGARRGELFPLTKVFPRLAGRQHAWANSVSEGTPAERIRACTDVVGLLIERVEARIAQGQGVARAGRHRSDRADSSVASDQRGDSPTPVGSRSLQQISRAKRSKLKRRRRS
jgi:transposase